MPNGLGAPRAMCLTAAPPGGAQDAVKIKKDHGGASGRGVDHPTISAVTDRPRRDRSGGQEAKDLGPIVRRQDDVLIFLVVARNTEALAPAGFAVGVVGVVDIHLQTALRVLE